jgi:hypothetical protein
VGGSSNKLGYLGGSGNYEIFMGGHSHLPIYIYIYLKLTIVEAEKDRLGMVPS